MTNMWITFDVACSGLRSLMALGTLGVVFAYFFRRRWIERGIIVASTIPIAVVVNAMQSAAEEEVTAVAEEAHDEREALREELVALRADMEKLLARLDEKPPAG